MNILPQVVVGVDVSKNHLDIYFTQLKKWEKVSNSKKAVKLLLKKFFDNQVRMVAYESTGGYEYFLQKELTRAGFNTWCIDPKRIKAFIKSRGIKAKTDRIDAKMIAEYAEKNEKNYDQITLSEDDLKLRSFMRRRVDLAEIIALEKRRMNHPKENYCSELLEDHIEYMQQQVKEIDKIALEMIHQNCSWEKKFKIIKSIPGIGEQTAAILIAFVPEIGLLENKKVAALVGVVPYTKQSGIYQGKEKIQEGRSIPRKALYMAALSTIQTDTSFGKFYAKLIERKKPSKVALVALMHKMIITVNAMVKKDSFWDPLFFS